MRVNIYRSQGRIVLVERGRELGLKPTLVQAIWDWISGKPKPAILKQHEPLVLCYPEGSATLRGGAQPKRWSSRWSNHRR